MKKKKSQHDIWKFTTLPFNQIYLSFIQQDEPNTRDARRIIFKEYQSKWGKNEVNKEPREPRGGLFFLVIEESLIEKVLQEWKTENHEMHWGKGDGHVYTSISIIIIYISMPDIVANLKFLYSTFAHASV